MTPPDSRLDALQRYVEGAASADDVALIERSLRSEPAFRRLVVDYLHLDSSLEEFATPAEVENTPWRAAPWLRRAWPAVALAASLAVGAFFWWPREGWRPAADREPIATVSNASGAVLFARGRPTTLPIGSTVSAGALDLQHGLLELTYPSGVVILLESPARFDLRNATTVWLSEGNLSARVPDTATGFTVATPSASIVDLGTEFGVSASARSSEVHVFKGEVLVQSSGEPDALRLTEHRASRIDALTRTPSGIAFQADRFVRNLEETPHAFPLAVRALEPVAYYRMRITPAATQLVDVTARRLHGRIESGSSRSTAAPGRFGAGLRLQGPASRSYAAVPDFPASTTGALSVCAWVRADSRPRWASIAKNWIKDLEPGTRGQFHFGLWHDDGTLEVQVQDAGLRRIGVRDDVPLPLDEWQFVAFTVDGTGLRLYRNGREVASAPCPGLTPLASAPLGIGVKLDATGRAPETRTPGFWDGALDEIAVFHTALTAAQIRSLYEAAR